MQLEKREMTQLLKIIRVLVQEACLDFSKCSNFAVLNVNGQTIVIEKSELNLLRRIISSLEGDLKW